MLQLTCKTCGAALKISTAAPKVKCEYCHTEYLIEQLLTERRIDNMDRVSQLKPIAENFYNMFNYQQAALAYEKLLLYDAQPVNIARYNLCLIGTNQVQPSKTLYETLSVLGAKERYKHIAEISDKAFEVAKLQYKMSLREYSGFARIKALYNIHKWVKTYKLMKDQVKEMKCTCGRKLSRGMPQCECGIERDYLLELESNRKFSIRLTVFIVLVTVCVFALKHIMG